MWSRKWFEQLSLEHVRGFRGVASIWWLYRAYGLKCILFKHEKRKNLLEVGVLRPKLQAVDSASGIFDATASSGAAVTELTLEQHKEFLLLKMEIKKLELEERRLSVRDGGGLAQVSVGSAGPSHVFDVTVNLKLVPPFCEQDPDTFFFFLLFERLAVSRNWSDADRTLLLQCILTGKAQQAYSALSVAESRVYVSVKAAVLQAYELVPEAIYTSSRIHFITYST